MTLNPDATQADLKNRIVQAMEELGLGSNNPTAHEILAEAIAVAVVSHVRDRAKVAIPGGSSAGVYSVTYP